MSGTDDEFCCSFKLGGIMTWVVFGGKAQMICYSLIVDPLYCQPVSSSSLTSSTSINLSLNQSLLIMLKSLKEESGHNGHGKSVLTASFKHCETKIFF